MASIITKKCPKCGETKPSSDFYKDKKGSGGLSTWCKECTKKDRRDAYRNNPEKYIKLVRDSYANNPAPTIARAKAWYKKHPEKVYARVRKWKRNNRDKVLELERKYNKNHPEKTTERNHRRTSRKKGNGGSFTADEWKGLKEFYNHKCLCCHRQEPEIKLEPDHVMPIVLGGNSFITNIQPLCRSCNARKGGKYIDYRDKIWI